MDNSKNILEKIEPKERKEQTNKVIGMMTFNNSKYSIVGSASLKAQKYPSDIDINNFIYFNGKVEDVKKKIWQKMKTLFNNLVKNDKIFIVDFKLGIDEELFQDFDNMEMIKDFYKNKKNILSNEEYNEIMKINNLDDLKEYTRKLYTLRWTNKEVQQGYKKVRGQKKTFIDALDDGAVIKLDVIALIDSEFIDMSNIFEFFIDDKKLNEEEILSKSKILKNLEEASEHLKKEKKYMKYMKRLFSIAKIKNRKQKVMRLHNILNSDLGKLYKANNDIDLLIILLEKGEKKKLKNVKSEIIDFIQQIKASIGQIYQFSIMTNIFNKFNDIKESDSFETIKKKLSKLLDYTKLKVNKEAYKIIKKFGIK